MDIKFTFSYVFDNHLAGISKDISLTEIDAALKHMEQFWNDNHTNFESFFKERFGLSFTETQIMCYLNTKASFSEPLSICIEDYKDMEDNLIHELMHVILTQNAFARTKAWQDMMDSYKKYDFLTRVHIPIHAMHAVFAYEFCPNRLPHLVKYSTHESYKKSWDIVKERGAHVIVQELFTV